MAGINTSVALASEACTTASLAKMAMTIFVSKRNLPFINIDLLAVLLDGLRHQLEVFQVYISCEMQQCFSGLANRAGKCASKVEYLTLLLNVQLIELIQY